MSFRRLVCAVLAVGLTLGFASRADATCWRQRDGKGYCCQAPGGKPSCHRYSEKELRQQREERARRQREHRARVERRRRAAAAAERVRRERDARIEAKRRAREKWLRENPDAARAQRRWQRREALRARERARRQRELRLARRRRRSRGAALDAWSSRWFELGGGAAGNVASPGVGATAAGGGFSASAALFWRRRYDASSTLSRRGSLAIAAIPVIGPMLGFFVVPKSTFIGNELGLGLTGQFTWVGGDGSRFRALLLLEPRLRVCPDGSRLRINSLLGFLLPKVGVEISSDGSRRWALEAMSFALAFALTKNIAVELEAAVLVRQGPADQRPTVGGNLRLELLLF